MSARENDSISLGDFSASLTEEGQTIHLRLTGNADMKAKESLDALLPRAHERALEQSAREVVIDMRHLEFMNSSCFKSFVTWISAAQELTTAKQYRMKFLSAPEMLWQRRSLHALRCFAVDIITIET